MSRNDFGSWGIELSADQFAAALMTLGIAGPLFPGFLPPTDLENLKKVFLELFRREEVINWRLLDSPALISKYYKPPDPLLFAEAWLSTTQNYWDPPIRIEARISSEIDILWISSQLARVLPQHGSVYVLEEGPKVDIDWNWPVHICIPFKDKLYTECKNEMDLGSWFSRQIKLISVSDLHNPIDVLLLPFGPKRALADYLSGTLPKRAASIILLGKPDESTNKTEPLLRSLKIQLDAGLIAIAPVNPERRWDWLYAFAREMSHNRTLDLAIHMASRKVKERPQIVLSSRDFLDKTRVQTYARSLGEKMVHRTTEHDMIAIDPATAAELGLAAGPNSARAVGHAMRSKVGDFGWRRELDEATAVEQIRLMAEPLLSKSAAPPPRYILAKVAEIAEGCERRLRERALRQNASHVVEVKISAPETTWIIAPEAFPEKDLPPDETGHDLTVVFTEPFVSPDPQVSSIFLPRVGESASCEFFFHTQAEAGRIEARIVVLYSNRVLQTLLLQANVVADPDNVSFEERIEFVKELDLRPGMRGLSDRTPFNGALLINKNRDGKSRLTTIIDKDAAMISLDDLGDAIDKIDQKLTGTNWVSEEMNGLFAKGTTELLRYLALHGSSIYQAIVEDHLIGGLLENAPRIQVIAARKEARLPIEFIYDRIPPTDPNAQICSRAAEALAEGKCSCDTENNASTICPLGFWGMNRIIERHAFDPAVKAKINGDFVLQAEVIAGRRQLQILRSALMASSQHAVLAVGPDALNTLIDGLQQATNGHMYYVETWKSWSDEVETDHPTLLVLFPHTLMKDELPCFEIGPIGKNEQLYSVELKKEHVCEDPNSPPLVLLLGCETGAPDVSFHGFVSKFRLRGAAIVVCTNARIRGRHAIPVAEQFVAELKALCGSGDVTFGDAMLRVRRKILGTKGLPMILCLWAYGDADWRI